jgi:hypothetical protein
MALLIHYIGTVTWRQNKPPSWGKNYAGETDTCKLQWQGAQYLEKAFLDSLTEYQSLSYIDENGTTVTDTGMKLVSFSSDDASIFPAVSLAFEGCRGGTTPDPVPTDDVTTQSASTTFTITDGSSPNFGKGITMAIQYYAARTSYEWAQLTNPAGVATYGTVRYPITYSGPYGDPNIWRVQFSGMVDAEGNPSNTISTGDATAVWNTFTFAQVVSGFQSREVIPGHVWKCNSTADALIIGNN